MFQFPVFFEVNSILGAIFALGTGKKVKFAHLL